jgi:hypothetical protein
MPGNEAGARRAPEEIPNRMLMNVAVPETFREREVIFSAIAYRKTSIVAV